MKVIDASALVELLIGTSRGLQAAEQLEDEEESRHMPHLADVEVANVPRRLAAAGAISDQSMTRVHQVVHLISEV